MKSLICLFVLTVASAVVSAQPGRDDFEKMTFEAELGKKSYIMSEPIFVKFKFSNKTGSPQTTYLPSFASDSKLLVTLEGKTSKFNRISAVGGGGVRLPGILNPNWFLVSDEILSTPFVSAFFPVPGTYQVQFVLHCWGGDKTIKSNITEVAIEEPAGIDKEASDFMRKHHKFFELSSWTPDDHESRTLLEEFVTKYGRSAYGEIAISSLGTFYLAMGEFDKAKAEFEKIKLSDNATVAKEANHSLADIARRMADLQKRQNEKPQ